MSLCLLFCSSSFSALSHLVRTMLHVDRVTHRRRGGKHLKTSGGEVVTTGGVSFGSSRWTGGGSCSARSFTRLQVHVYFDPRDRTGVYTDTCTVSTLDVPWTLLSHPYSISRRAGPERRQTSERVSDEPMMAASHRGLLSDTQLPISRNLDASSASEDF